MYDIGCDESSHGRGARRLLALADYLDKVSPVDYDHRHWKKERGEGLGCTRCALGHGIDQIGNILNLKWGNFPNTVVHMDGTPPSSDNIFGMAAEVFEISIDESMMIFGLSHITEDFYNCDPSRLNPQLVASRIREFALQRLPVYTG